MIKPTPVRKAYTVTFLVTLKVWAYSEGDALREASQMFSVGFPTALRSLEVIGQPAAKAD